MESTRLITRKYVLLIHDCAGDPSLLHLIIMLHSRLLCYKPKGRGFESRGCHWNFLFE
jgi:hypothetical protein